MKLNPRIIFEHLGALNPVYQGVESNELSIVGCQLLTSSARTIHSDVLYIGRLDEAIQHPNIRDVRFLLCDGTPDRFQPDPRFTGEIIFVDDASDLVELNNTITDIFDYYHRWDEKLKSNILGENNISRLLETAYEAIKNPIALFDKSFRCVAYCGREFIPENDLIWTSVIEHGHTNLDLTPSFEAENISPKLRNSEKAFIYTLPEVQHRCIHSNIFIGKDSVASISLSEMQSPFTPETLILVDYISDLFAAALVSHPVFKNAIYDIDQLSIAILENGVCDVSVLEFWLSSRKWRITDSYQIMVFKPGNNSISDSESVYVHHFQQRLAECGAFVHDENIVVIQNLSRTPIKRQKRENDILAWLEKIDYLGGISDPFGNYLDLKTYYLQARAALSHTYAGMKAKRLITFDTIMIQEVLDSCAHRLPLTSFCHPSIRRLHEYDQVKGSEYVKSLYVYLMNGKKLTETASRLFIHRNTLIYRLKKIDEITGDLNSPTDSDYVLKILLSCRIVLGKNLIHQSFESQ